MTSKGDLSSKLKRGAMSRSRSDVKSGCYYAPESYASLSERLVAMLIDGVVFISLFVIVTFTVDSLPLPSAPNPEEGLLLQILIILFTLAAAGWLYFIELARSRSGTIGLRAMKIRVVNLKGEKPGRLQMLSRLWNGPLHELLRVPLEPEKNTIGDKLCGLYVIKRDAAPAGYGPIVHDYCSMFGSMHWYISEVKH